MGSYMIEKNLKRYFVQPGHDPINAKNCDICKGREIGILDYRKTLLFKVLDYKLLS